MSIMVLKAQDPVYGGFVLAREEGVIFIKGALPDETVQVELIEKKRDYSVAQTIDIVEPSMFRVEPPCPYFDECGGCHLQFASYEKQAAMKNSILLDCLKRIGGLETELAQPMTGEPFGYRRRAQFKVSRLGEIGFYREGTHDVVVISKCPLMVPEINELLEKLRQTGLSGIKEVHVTSGDGLEVLLKGAAFDEERAEEFIEMGLSCVAFDGESYLGSGYVSLDLEGLEYSVSPFSFFQSNWELNRRVARAISDEYDGISELNILDLYAGAGNFSLLLARDGNNITAIEGNHHAIRDGERNIKTNKVKKYKYAKGSVENARLKDSYDLVLLDPPRSGLSKTSMERLLSLSPTHIAYVSCNPSTFARDLKILLEQYDLKSVRMVDFFPNTYHVESLAFLIKKTS